MNLAKHYHELILKQNNVSKKLIITLSLFFIVGNFSISKAQNILPDVGSVLIDSTLSVRDTAVFKSRVTIDDKLLLKNGVRVWESARFEDNLRVMSTARVDKLVVDGNAVFKGNVRMDSIGYIPNGALNSGGYEQIVILPNGQLKKFSNLISESAELEGISLCPSGSEFVDVTNPMWYSGLNKLVSPCPKVRVGIATQSPEYQLDVRGMTYTSFLKVGQLNAEHNAFINCYGSVTGGGTDFVNLGVYDSYDNQTQTLFKIKGDGTVYAKEIWVRSPSTFPDYVFEKDYKLMSLENLAAYIQKNKHLPNMPTAKFVAENGMSLNEIQRVLVEKVEELTLYMIDFNKKIKNIEKENKNLKNECTKLSSENKNLKDELKDLKKEVAEIKKSVKQLQNK